MVEEEQNKKKTWTSIRVSLETKERLEERGRKGESYEFLLQDILDRVEGKELTESVKTGNKEKREDA